MCGRFALFSNPHRIGEIFSLPPPPEPWERRYNIPPGTWVVGILHDKELGEITYRPLWWGYKPHWAGDSAPEPINAKAENLENSKYFRGAFHHQRCLIPADGWFEWKTTSSGKQPYFVRREDQRPVFFAGIWETREDEASCCAILTEPARDELKGIHPRMPVVLSDGSLESWLDTRLQDKDAIKDAVTHLDPECLVFYPVSRDVNNAAYDEPDVLDPLV